MAQPGLPSAAVPSSDDWIARELGELRQQLQSLSSSVGGLAAIQAQQATLTAQQAALAAQVAFLAGQTTMDYISGGVGTVTGVLAAAWAASYDIARTVTTSSTGVLWVVWGAGIRAITSGTYSGDASVYVDVVDVSTGSVVAAPATVAGVSAVPNSANVNVRASVSAAATLTLTPNHQYTVRTRRTYASGPSGSADISGVWLTVTKLGI